MKQILVTGATGFIGRALCKQLVASGYNVRCALRNEHNRNLLPRQTESVMVGDIDGNTDWDAALGGVDAVIHLAARVHVMKGCDSVLYRATNIDGTEQLAAAAANAGVKRFIFMSSIKVNGEATNLAHPFTEERAPCPLDAYGQSKWEAEQKTKKICADSAMTYVILRPPLVYGPGVGANFLKLLSLVKSRVPLPFKTVINRRSFIFIGNLVSIIEATIVNPNAANQTFLVSDGVDVSTSELIMHIGDTLGFKARLMAMPGFVLNLLFKLTRRTSMQQRLLGSLQIDSTKLQRELDWQAEFTLKEGLLETTAWFQQQKETV